MLWYPWVRRGGTSNDRLGGSTGAGSIPLTAAHYAALAKAYGGPARAYHALGHACAVIEPWRDVDQRLGWTRRAETFLALIYHDAIYVAGRSDNEEASAASAREQIDGLTALDMHEVERLIRLTAQHGRLTPRMVDRDAGLLLDCDMAILGAMPDDFAVYEAGIRSEYAHVPEPW